MHLDTLEMLCLHFISKNEFVHCYINVIKDMPAILIQRLAYHLSPYGLYLLEKNGAFQGSCLKEKWLTQWQLPICCRLDIRKYLEESIKWQTYGSNKQFTEQEIFYNCLMKDIIESLQLRKPVEQCHETALLHFLSYPNCCWLRTSNKCKDKGLSEKFSKIWDLKSFLICLSSHVNLLHITASTATIIFECMDVFQVIINKIFRIYINLIHGPYMKLNSLCSIITQARKYNLQSIKLSYNSNLKNFDSSGVQKIYSSICDGLTLANIFSVDDYDKELICNEDETTLNCNDDLFDVAVESLLKSKPVDTKITELEIITNDKGFSNVLVAYLPMWTNLESLRINTITMEENIFSFFQENRLSKSSLKLLEISPFDVFPDSNILDMLYSRCLVHQRKEFHITKFVYHGQIPLPVLANILKTPVCLNEKNHNNESCHFTGITSLATYLGTDFNIAPFLVGNILLKELKLYQSCDYQYDNDIYEALIDHPFLETFKMVANYRKIPSPIFPSFSSFLYNKNLTQLSIERCFNSGSLGEGVCSALSVSNLVVLIWADNGLENEGLNEISSIIMRNGLLKIQKLDLRNNLFDNQAVSLFADSLVLSCRYLHKLVINLQHKKREEKSFLMNLQDKLHHHVQTIIGCSPKVVDSLDYVSEM